MDADYITKKPNVYIRETKPDGTRTRLPSEFDSPSFWPPKYCKDKQASGKKHFGSDDEEPGRKRGLF